MTQLGIGVAALNHDSSFQAAYEKGMKKSEYWIHTLEDCINLIAKLPTLAARIYRNIYKPGTSLVEIDKDLDLVGKGLDFMYSAMLKNVMCRKLFQAFGIRR
jgi:citrate synthase